MTLPTKGDTSAEPVDTRMPLLNVDLYDALAAQQGLHTVTAQAKRHEVQRTYWSDIHNRKRSPGFKLASRVARQLGSTIDALWPEEIVA